ncbi:hypothetical protein F0562_035784 [Nyssa sinensis]|uniref:CSC1/OSCA1-like 7TM region domain-containing protein n=1 Tax=Nyssa sinensis TaxID=561372 RepID=A0A5J5ADW2_9ASTE|nr:hypothetical protein F0562_035784 [Nyssa sinensis]
MNLSALLTSAGINIALCVVLLSLYSILRKQPSNINVYFGRRLAQVRSIHDDFFCFDRFVPSPSWIVKAWETSEEDILATGGLDAVVFLRIVVFSIRIFSIGAIICIFLVLPVNYFGQEMQHKLIPSESLEVFTIGNVKEGSKWLWAHCVALYVISCSACVLLYFEYKSITDMRLAHITGSPPNPSHFTVLVRGIPWSSEESYSDQVRKFFTNYHASSYLSHQMVYQSGTIQKLMNDAAKMYRVLKFTANEHCGPSLIRCGLCGGTPISFKMLSSESESVNRRNNFGNLELRGKECAAALVFFRTRYAAVVASQVPQSSHPMLWVTNLAPEPHDIYWKNLSTVLKNLVLDLKMRDVPTLFARAVPIQGTFFMTYVMTSGWASLSSELMQPFGLLWNWFDTVILRNKDNPSYGTLSFPYHTEIPRVLLFGLLGFTCSILAPLILPFLLVYFFLAYLVYRNQILNVYMTKYESGGKFWPIVHNTTIFSLVLTQIIAMGVFGLKESTVASGFTIPLIIFTLLFNEYCRKRFHPIFKNNVAQVLIEMDQLDEQCGRMGEIYRLLHSAYCQFPSTSDDSFKAVHQNNCENGDGGRLHGSEGGTRPGLIGERLTETLCLESGK